MTKFGKLQKSFLDISLTKVSGFTRSFFQQVLLLSKESAPKQSVLSRLLFCIKISSPKEREYLIVNSFCIISDKMGTECFTSL